MERKRDNQSKGKSVQSKESDFNSQPHVNTACELYVNYFKLKTENVYAYLIDWGEKIRIYDR